MRTTRLSHHARLRYAALFVVLAAPIHLAAEGARQPEEIRALSVGHELSGYASWYGGKFQGRLTANGERFDTNELTAAHKTLPFNTIVEVRHIANGRTVRVRINDRGPFVDGRVIDLSRAAADSLGMTAEGVARVDVRIVAPPPQQTKIIQIAAFSSRRSADALAARLVVQGLPAVTESATDVYRVVIPGVAESDVPAVQTRLAQLGHPRVLVRSR